MQDINSPTLDLCLSSSKLFKHKGGGCKDGYKATGNTHSTQPDILKKHSKKHEQTLLLCSSFTRPINYSYLSTQDAMLINQHVLLTSPHIDSHTHTR